MVVSDLLFMTSANAGDHIAHIGVLGSFWFVLVYLKEREDSR